MIGATISSRSCFYWLYRASPSSTVKNITNLISLLTIWWFPCLESSLVFEKRVFAVTNVFSPQNAVSLYPAWSSIPRPNVPLTPGVSWLPYFCFPVPYDEKNVFFCVSSRRCCNSLQNRWIQLLWHQWLRHRLGLLRCWMICLGNKHIILSFFRLPPSTAFWILFLPMRATLLLLREK